MKAFALVAVIFVLVVAFAVAGLADMNSTVSISVRDANAREVIDLIGTSANLDIKFDSPVRGNVTLSLTDVPAGTALRLVANTLGLEMSESEGEVHLSRPSRATADLSTLKRAIADIPEPQLGYRVYLAPETPTTTSLTSGYGLYGGASEENFVTEKVPIYFADSEDIAYIFGGDVIETRMSDYSGGGGGYGGGNNNNYGHNNNDNNNYSSNRNNNNRSNNNNNNNYNTSW